MSLLLLFAAATAQPRNETPRAFVERVYASYAQPDYSPFIHPERVFAPRLLAAINEDRRLNGDEVGYIGGDPVCQCQDTAGLRATITKVVVQDRNHARVRVSISLQGYAPRPAMFTLVRMGALASRVPMPKTAVHKHSQFVPGKYEIGCAWKVGAMNAKPIAERVSDRSNSSLCGGVPRANTSHQAGSLVRREPFGHSRLLTDFTVRTRLRI